MCKTVRVVLPVYVGIRWIDDYGRNIERSTSIVELISKLRLIAHAQLGIEVIAGPLRKDRRTRCLLDQDPHLTRI